MLGDVEDGALDELVVRGSNVLEREISAAKSIPEQERLLVRCDSSIRELATLSTKKKQHDLKSREGSESDDL